MRASIWMAVGAVALSGVVACDDGGSQALGDTEDTTPGEDTAGPFEDAAGPDEDAPQGVGVAQSDEERITEPLIAQPDQAALTDANGDFAFSLYQEIRSEPGNLFYSPHSISLALAMTWAGAAGDTASQMADALHFDLAEGTHAAFNWLDLELATRDELPPEEAEDGEGFALRIVNRLWGQEGYPFEDAFLDTLALHYGAGLYLLDFVADAEAARLTINEWIEEQTEERIQDLLPQGSVDALTRLVLTNAIYFLAPWDSPFEPEATSDGDFTTAGGETVTVPMMHQTSDEYRHAEGDGWTAVELAYNGNQLSMVIFVPADLGAFEASLTGESVRTMLGELSRTRVALTMPRFEFEAELPLAAPLKALGMTDAFDAGAADFSAMTPDPDAYVSSVLHKAFVRVDEEGTEAAAATAVVVGTTSEPPPPVPVVVDQPFVFLIRDIPTGAILFVGRVTDPTAD